MIASYDSREGVTLGVSSDYAAFCRLLQLRHEAGYERNERLSEWIVWGGDKHQATDRVRHRAYRLDSCGNVWVSDRPLSIGNYPTATSIETEFEGALLVFPEADLPLYGLSGGITWGLKGLPGAEDRCEQCGRGWVVRNAWDNVGKTEDLVVACPYDLFGRTAAYAQTRRSFPFGLKPGFDKWLKRDGVWCKPSPDTLLQEGDLIDLGKTVYKHGACNKAFLSQADEVEFGHVFRDAGFFQTTFSRIPNEYCSCEHCPCWFDVITEFGAFKVGWRKRVISLDWSRIGDFSFMFTNEQVTVWKGGIHAWSSEALTSYLARIHDNQAAMLASGK